MVPFQQRETYASFVFKNNFCVLLHRIVGDGFQSGGHLPSGISENSNF